MLRLLAYDEVIQDKTLARTLLKAGVAGLYLGWQQDLGELEVVPGLFAMNSQPLTEIPPGIYELLWEHDGSMEQLMFTSKAIFWGSKVYPLGNGITKVLAGQLNQLKVYLTGSGTRLIAFGDPVDPNTRKYQPYRSSDKVPQVLSGMVILGQVDLETGEIWPLPQELMLGDTPR